MASHPQEFRFLPKLNQNLGLTLPYNLTFYLCMGSEHISDLTRIHVIIAFISNLFSPGYLK